MSLDSRYIYNESTGRWVLKSGAVGKKILQSQSGGIPNILSLIRRSPPWEEITSNESSGFYTGKRKIKPRGNSVLEQQMVRVMNLNPGENTELLHLQVYMVDLKKDGPLKANPMNPGLTWTDNLRMACRWVISETYYQEALKNADFGVFAICDKYEDPDSSNDLESRWPSPADFSESSENETYNGFSGPQSFAIGKMLPDGQSCYIDLICNAKNVNLKVPFGEIMLLSLLNHFHYLGAKHAFNHAANIDLIPHYARNTWSIQTKGTNCDDKDDIAEQFNALPYSETKEFVEDLESKGSVDVTSSGYPMKLCNYNFNEMFGRLLSLSQKKHREAIDKGLDLSTVCYF